MKNTKNIKKELNFDVDQLLANNNLNYSDINFEPADADILKSYYSLNNKIKSKSYSFKNIFKHFNFSLILKPAYTIILTAIVVIAVIHFKNLTNPVEYAEINVDKGEKITLHVTQDFTIYLNSESSIKIPLELNRNAEIILTGEAYFEIKSRKKIKIIADGILFESKHSNLYINTKNANELIAQVFSGNVESYNPNLPKSTKLELKPNSKLLYNNIAEFISVEHNNSKNTIAWHTGNLSFNEKSLQTVVNEISAYFDVPMEIKNKDLSKQTYSVTFNNPQIDEILDIIQHKFNCNISTDGSKIIIN